MADALDTGELPVALSIPVSITARNAEHKLDIIGRATHLDEKGLVATFQVEVPEGTVLFTTLDMRSINSTVRGLIKVKSQTAIGEHGGYRTIADFVDLNDDGKRKIAKMLGGPAEDLAPVASRSFAVDQIATQHTGGYVRTPQAAANAPDYRPPMAAQGARRAYFEPAPLRTQAKASTSTRFWGSLGVTFYVVLILVIIAFFPQGRAFELLVLNYVGYALSRMWYWANNIGHVKLYNNS
ncbi:MAG TPA: hypothetical protein VKF82_10805 [Candidatus Eremiobacteraceae bacterium]|nr:hypothetical protein [Candidatus Eremiobacteraceae bacterium]